MGNHRSGRRGLPPELVAEVKRLLAAGLSGRHVSRLTGVDPKTIRKLVRLDAHLARQQPRCGGCGKLIKTRPCLVCAARVHRNTDDRPRCPECGNLLRGRRCTICRPRSPRSESEKNSLAKSPTFGVTSEA